MRFPSPCFTKIIDTSLPISIPSTVISRIQTAYRNTGFTPCYSSSSEGLSFHHAQADLSVDHLEYVGDEEIAALKGSETMPTVLPGAAFFLNMPYSPVRKMINAGLPVALASDFNPGSSPSGNMKFVMSLGCVNYKMLPEEVINATTINSAYAMGVEEELGSIAVGKKANFYITTPITGIEYLPYAYGTDLVEAVFLNGEQI